MHPTADTPDFIFGYLAGRRVIGGVRRRYDEGERCSEEPRWRKTYAASCGLTSNLGAA